MKSLVLAISAIGVMAQTAYAVPGYFPRLLLSGSSPTPVYNFAHYGSNAIGTIDYTGASGFDGGKTTLVSGLTGAPASSSFVGSFERSYNLAMADRDKNVGITVGVAVGFLPDFPSNTWFQVNVPSPILTNKRVIFARYTTRTGSGQLDQRMIYLANISSGSNALNTPVTVNKTATGWSVNTNGFFGQNTTIPNLSCLNASGVVYTGAGCDKVDKFYHATVDTSSTPLAATNSGTHFEYHRRRSGVSDSPFSSNFTALNNGLGGAMTLTTFPTTIPYNRLSN